MKRGFTLLELIIVIIILGVLATLGLSQYGNMIEKSRGAEAKAIMGDMRSFAAAYRMEKGGITGVTADQLSLGAGPPNIPSGCTGTHYFSYTFATVLDPIITFTATRCTAGGKTPTGSGATILLGSNLGTGLDTWVSTTY